MDTANLLDQLRIDRNGRRPRRRGRWIGVAVAALLALAALAWLASVRLAPPTVRVAVARTAAGPAGAGSVLDASGYVTARRQATVSAKVTGKVVEVNIEEGQRVEEGAVLARLDDTEARAELGWTRAQLAAARAQEGEIRAGLQQAEQDYARSEELFKRQLVAAQSIDAARSQRDVQRARLAANAEQVSVATEAVRRSEVALDSTVIRAPFAGVVVAKSAQPGEMISPISAGGGFTRTGIGTIVDMDSLEIQVDVNESFIGRVRADQRVEATLNAYPDWKVPGSVIAIIPTADRSKATVKVRIAIQSKDARIVPDMGVRVAFLDPPAPASKPARPAVLIPADAVRADGAVFVVTEGRVARRSVTLARTVGTEREVLAGVAAGERVVTAPPASLADGATVRVAE